MAGPVGWIGGGVLALGGGFLAIKNNKKTAEKAEAKVETFMHRDWHNDIRFFKVLQNFRQAYDSGSKSRDNYTILFKVE